MNFKTLTEWEDKNKAKVFLLITEVDIKEYFTSKDIKDVDIYECINDVYNAYDLHNEYQHIMDTIHERVEEKIKEKKDANTWTKNSRDD